ncbi:MAG: hypothetical protein JXA57_20435, partial [Armatimonadetes bacterium]|nr:hypothetical protein [Armatimonadota bacterium]
MKFEGHFRAVQSSRGGARGPDWSGVDVPTIGVVRLFDPYIGDSSGLILARSAERILHYGSSPVVVTLSDQTDEADREARLVPKVQGGPGETLGKPVDQRQIRTRAGSARVMRD